MIQLGGATLEISAPFTAGITVLLGVLVVLFCGWLYATQRQLSRAARSGLLLLRLALFGLVLALLHRPTLHPFHTELPELLLLIDDSRSMATVDADAEQERDPEHGSRLEQARSLLLADEARLLRHLTRHYRLRHMTLSASQARFLPAAEAASAIRQIQATHEASPLGEVVLAAVRQARGRTTAAAVLFSDGRTTRGIPVSAAAQEARAAGIPLVVVGLGSERPPRDVALTQLDYAEHLFQGERVSISVGLRHRGFAAQEVEIRLRAIDSPVPLKIEKVTLDANPEVTVSFELPPQPVGQLDFVVELVTVPGEASTENNAKRGRVQVHDQAIRVLLVWAYPSYEFHYLRTLLSREDEAPAEPDTPPDAPLVLHSYLQHGEVAAAAADARTLPAFPSREQLLEYDVCVFGDVDPTLLGTTALQDLRDFVTQRGRAWVGIAGPQFFPAQYAETPLAELVPFSIPTSRLPAEDAPLVDGFRPQPTPLGSGYPIMRLAETVADNRDRWSQLAQLHWMLEIHRPHPGTLVLAEHPTGTTAGGTPLPVILLGMAGSGRVLFHATDESWRWRIGQGDLWFGRYWKQTLRYLSRGKLQQAGDVQLASDRARYLPGEPVRVAARFVRPVPRGQTVRVMLEGERSPVRAVELVATDPERRRFATTLANLSIDRFRGWLGGQPDQTAPLAFEVARADRESDALRADLTGLRQAARSAGTRFYTYNDAGRLPADLPRGRRIRVGSAAAIPLWNRWPVPLLFLVLLALEWSLRRRAGLP